MRKILQVLIMCSAVAVNAQVGIGNTEPRGLLDINNVPAVTDAAGTFSGTGADSGIVLPIVQDVTALTTAVEGTGLRLERPLYKGVYHRGKQSGFYYSRLTMGMYR